MPKNEGQQDYGTTPELGAEDFTPRLHSQCKFTCTLLIYSRNKTLQPRLELANHRISQTHSTHWTYEYYF